VGGFTTMLVAVPASVAASWLMGMRLAFAIAHLGGHDIYEPSVCNLAFAAMTGEPGLGGAPNAEDSSGGGGWGSGVAAAGEVGSVDSQKLAQTVGQAQLQRAMAAAASRGLSEAAASEMAEAAAKR
jgi:hypothetical protein